MLGAWAGDRYGYTCWLERVDCLEVDWMENQLDVIVRRLSEVPSVKGNVRTANTGPLDGPGISRYQRRSAHLRDRDCSVVLVGPDGLGVDLTGD